MPSEECDNAKKLLYMSEDAVRRRGKITLKKIFEAAFIEENLGHTNVTGVSLFNIKFRILFKTPVSQQLSNFQLEARSRTRLTTQFYALFAKCSAVVCPLVSTKRQITTTSSHATGWQASWTSSAF